MGAIVEFNKKDVAAHATREDCWMTIHGEGKYYDSTMDEREI